MQRTIAEYYWQFRLPSQVLPVRPCNKYLFENRYPVANLHALSVLAAAHADLCSALVSTKLCTIGNQYPSLSMLLHSWCALTFLPSTAPSSIVFSNPSCRLEYDQSTHPSSRKLSSTAVENNVNKIGYTQRQCDHTENSKIATTKITDDNGDEKKNKTKGTKWIQERKGKFACQMRQHLGSKVK